MGMPTQPDTPLPILYSFRRCPYAMRARLAIAVSGRNCELREVVLKAKPQDLLDASPKATVPVLVETDGHVIDQSLDIRSEEHTSELQSLMRTSYAVFCLKKKTEK